MRDCHLQTEHADLALQENAHRRIQDFTMEFTGANPGIYEFDAKANCYIDANS